MFMKMKDLVEKRVSLYYDKENLNCAITTLKILSEYFHIDVNDQVIKAATGMSGAGNYIAQCGLVDGTIMFLGIWGKECDLPELTIKRLCRKYVKQFDLEYGSVVCKDLRPKVKGSHICGGLTSQSVEFSINFINLIKE